MVLLLVGGTFELEEKEKEGEVREHLSHPGIADKHAASDFKQRRCKHCTHNKHDRDDGREGWHHPLNAFLAAEVSVYRGSMRHGGWKPGYP